MPIHIEAVRQVVLGGLNGHKPSRKVTLRRNPFELLKIELPVIRRIYPATTVEDLRERKRRWVSN